MKTYVVRQGDYLDKIAHAAGVDADTLWNDPANADLKAARDPNQLCPGDILRLPDTAPTDLPLKASTGNDFSADVPTTTVTIQLVGDDGAAVANAACTIRGIGEEQTVTADGEGHVVVTVPVNLREFEIEYPHPTAGALAGGDPDLPPLTITLSVLVGDMDPLAESSGVRKRLRNLGYYPRTADPDDPPNDEHDDWAIKAFQTARGLEATGVIDDALRDALKDTHAS